MKWEGKLLLSVERQVSDVRVITRTQDHKLRKYLSLKLDFEYLKFYRTHCFNYLQM